MLRGASRTILRRPHRVCGDTLRQNGLVGRKRRGMAVSIRCDDAPDDARAPIRRLAFPGGGRWYCGSGRRDLNYNIMSPDSTLVVKQFEALLSRFSAMRGSVLSASSADAARFRQLLADFHIASARADNAEIARTRNLPEGFKHLLKDFRAAIERWRQSQEQTADDFNLLDVMGITGRETMHSGVLAWLLSGSLRGSLRGT